MKVPTLPCLPNKIMYIVDGKYETSGTRDTVVIVVTDRRVTMVDMYGLYEFGSQEQARILVAQWLRRFRAQGFKITRIRY